MAEKGKKKTSNVYRRILHAYATGDGMRLSDDDVRLLVDDLGITEDDARAEESEP